jgi:hypothetical protein
MGGFGRYSKNRGRGGGGIRSLTDVGWSLPVTADAGEVLTYNGNKWTPVAPSEITNEFADGGDTAGAARTLGNKDSYALSFTTADTTRMQIKNNGYIGIGSTGNDVTHMLTLPNDSTGNNGKAKAFAYATYSSRRYKENIELIKDPLDLINRIEGVTYTWKDSGYSDIGFVAEDVGKIIPSIVDYEPNGTDAIAMDYTRLNAVLVEAVKAQDKKVKAQNDKLEKLIILVDSVHSFQHKKINSIFTLLNPPK